MHVPVLLREALQYLDPQNGDFVIDGTINGGGHAREILTRTGKTGKLLGVDWDADAIAALAADPAFSGRNFVGVHANYAQLPRILGERGLPKADGLLLDLGVSSFQLEGSGRGFSFLKDEPLQMTYDCRRPPAERVLLRLSQRELADVIFRFGGERYARRVARAIEANRPVATSGKLAEIVRRALPRGYERGRIHPATRTFQALRVLVNDELENLRTVLSNLPRVLKKGGRVVVISFHSLEDGTVKEKLRALEKERVLEILTPKPVVPSREEVLKNPRSRSAKLRAAKVS